MSTVRQAAPEDKDRVQRLSQRAERVILHFAAQDIGDCLTRRPFLLAEEAGRLRGFLACFLTRPPRAALAAAGLADDWTISAWLDELLPRCVASLQAQGATSLSYIGSAAWLTRPLQDRGFHLVSNIVGYERRGRATPEDENSRVQIHPVRREDFPSLVNLDRLAFHPLWRNSVETLRRWQETVPFFVVAVAEEELAGYCYGSLKEGHGHLIRMAVHPAWQGQGVGSRLVAEALQFFQQADVQLVTLNTQEENERAQRLYRKFGFQLTGQEAVALWLDL
jgi:ribosomal-protein-alanine N-acetyltransferase